jgi:uncharacterized membrane protein YebE (DUF533 family)
LPADEASPRWPRDFAAWVGRAGFAREKRNFIMKLAVLGLATLAATLGSLVSTAPVEAKGCLKGALVGGVAGHYAGHHAVLGALGGCVVGRHLANEKDKQPPAAAQGEPAPQAAAPPAHNGY